MEGCDEGLVCVAEQRERLGAVRVGFVELDGVVDNGVRVQMLSTVS